MSAFKDIEEAENKTAAALLKQYNATQAKMDKVVKCVHRRPVGIYNTKCDHSERQTGRRCVNLDCPVIQ